MNATIFGAKEENNLSSCKLLCTIDCMKIGDLVDDGRIVSKLVPEFYVDSFVRG